MSELKTTVQVRLYPTPEPAAILRVHCQEYISTVNVLVSALESGVLPDGGKGGQYQGLHRRAAQRRQEPSLAGCSLHLEPLIHAGGPSGAAQPHLPVEQSKLAGRRR
jgi:hypothetical protein